MVYGSNTALWNKSYNAYYFTGLGYYGNSNFPISRQIYDDVYQYSKGYKVTKSKNYSDYFTKDYDIISLGKSYTISGGVVSGGSSGYSSVDGKELTDGVYSGDAYGTDWVALKGNSSYDIVVDLGGEYTAITDIDVNFENNNSSGIYLPKKVSAYSSIDGSNYTYIGDLSWNYNNSKINFNMTSLKLNSAVTGRYIKIHIESNNSLCFTFLSEITVGQRYSVVYYGNGGSFIPGTIENALEHKGPQFHYRNECLCRGMVNFNMIDTVGRGIKKIYTEQRNRFFPMPDYDIDNEHRTVGVTIYGKMIDEKYTNLLKSNQSLSLKECLWLDAVQKHHPVTKEAAKHLCDKGLIEGRAPHYTISLKVAKLTKQIGHYTKEKGLAENSIQKLLLQLAHNAGSMGFKRQDVYEGLQHVFPSNLTHDEKLRKIGRLLGIMSKEGLISKPSTGKRWNITEKGETELGA